MFKTEYPKSIPYGLFFELPIGVVFLFRKIFLRGRRVSPFEKSQTAVTLTRCHKHPQPTSHHPHGPFTSSSSLVVVVNDRNRNTPVSNPFPQTVARKRHDVKLRMCVRKYSYRKSLTRTGFTYELYIYTSRAGFTTETRTRETAGCDQRSKPGIKQNPSPRYRIAPSILGLFHVCPMCTGQ